MDTLVAFCAPLLRVVGDDPERMDRVLLFGAAVWNMSSFHEGRDKMLDELVEMVSGDAEERATLRAVAVELLSEC